MDKLIARQGELMDFIDSHNAWELDNRIEVAMHALRCPEPDTPGEKSFRWRAQAIGFMPFAAAGARYSVTLLAYQPPRCRNLLNG